MWVLMEFDDDYDGSADRVRGMKEEKFVLLIQSKMSWK
jgi:hypothetical protein